MTEKVKVRILIEAIAPDMDDPVVSNEIWIEVDEDMFDIGESSVEEIVKEFDEQIHITAKDYQDQKSDLWRDD